MITRLSIVPDLDVDPVVAPGSLANLQEHNAHLQQQAADRVIATIRHLREHGVDLGAASIVADARVEHPHLTYDELGAVTGLSRSAVGHAIWLIETKARLVQHAA